MSAQDVTDSGATNQRPKPDTIEQRRVELDKAIRTHGLDFDQYVMDILRHGAVISSPPDEWQRFINSLDPYRYAKQGEDGVWQISMASLQSFLGPWRAAQAVGISLKSFEELSAITSDHAGLHLYNMYGEEVVRFVEYISREDPRNELRMRYISAEYIIGTVTDIHLPNVRRNAKFLPYYVSIIRVDGQWQEPTVLFQTKRRPKKRR